jgi:hypothetical protein
MDFTDKKEEDTQESTPNNLADAFKLKMQSMEKKLAQR